MRSQIGAICPRACVAGLLLLGPLVIGVPQSVARSQDAPWPDARARHHAIYDPVTRGLVVYGGADTDNSLWTWASGVWRSQPVTPPLRYNDAMTYDSRRDRFILYGGSGRPDETWEWDRRTWRLVSTRGPGARGHHTIQYDPARHTTVLFGHNDDTPATDTWGWDGREWRQLATTGPPARGVFGSAFDARRRVLVVFGGCCASGVGLLGDTWEWDGKRWNRILTADSPSPRFDASMAYDVARGRIVLFGGRNRATDFADLWAYDGTNWSALPAAGPSSRSGQSLTYDPDAKVLRLFGGQHGRTLFRDFWAFDGQWRQIK